MLHLLQLSFAGAASIDRSSLPYEAPLPFRKTSWLPCSTVHNAYLVMLCLITVRLWEFPCASLNIILLLHRSLILFYSKPKQLPHDSVSHQMNLCAGLNEYLLNEIHRVRDGNPNGKMFYLSPSCSARAPYRETHQLPWWRSSWQRVCLRLAQNNSVSLFLISTSLIPKLLWTSVLTSSK